VRNRVERILDFAAVRGWRADDNPARWRGFLDSVLPAPRKIAPVKNMAAVPHADVPALMAALAADETVASAALRLIILSACRLSEVTEAVWSEVNFETAEWVIPKERMKGRREHRVPLAPQAIELLKGLYVQEGNPFVFLGGKPGTHINESTVGEALRCTGRTETIHGFRSSFRDWTAERTNFPGIVAELALSHRVGSATENAYRRSDLVVKRRKLMEAWAAYCTTVPTTSTGTVLTLRGRT
jgi:integrase